MKQRGFTLIETLFSLGLLLLLLAMFLPWWTSWQQWLSRSLAQSSAEWESDFVAHRLYYKSLQNTVVQSATQLLFTGADARALYIGSRDARIYEESGNRRYLTYAPVQVENWSVLTSGSLLHATAQLGLAKEQQQLDVYVP